MPSTRSSQVVQSQSPLDGEARSQRFRRELDIHGHDSLRGGEVDRRPSDIYIWNGTRFEVPTTGIPAGGSGLKKRPASDPAPSQPAPKRKCSRSEQPGQPISSPVSKKRKRSESNLARDPDFLQETIRQLKRIKVPAKTSRHTDIEWIMPFLTNLEPVHPGLLATKAPVGGQPSRDAPEAYELTGQEAGRLLRNPNGVSVPVFVVGSALELLDSESGVRPVEQILEWCPDPNESLDTVDLESALVNNSIAHKEVTIVEIRDRFINQNQKYQQYPLNCPDIPFPMPPAVPTFLRHPSCNLLQDIVRHLQDLEDRDICHPTCKHYGKTAQKCKKHFVTAEEIIAAQTGFKYWQGTLMLAAPGSLTQTHYDTFGFSTFISCYEGEIGFAWLSNTTEEERKERRAHAEPSNRWRYKVLRPGNAVYMPPGTRHIVFRLPHGEQTAGSAIHLIRYRDVVEWLQYMSQECQETFEDSDDPVDFGRVYRALVLGVRHYIKQAKVTPGGLEKFGGKEKVAAAEKLIRRIESYTKTL